LDIWHKLIGAEQEFWFCNRFRLSSVGSLAGTETLLELNRSCDPATDQSWISGSETLLELNISSDPATIFDSTFGYVAQKLCVGAEQE
jgi:hypothetical protein